MKQIHVVIAFVLLGALCLCSDYYFFNTQQEFVVRQFCWVIAFSIMAFMCIDRFPYAYLIACACVTLAITGFIKELRHDNTKVEQTQIIITIIVAMGLAIGLVDQFWTYLKSKKP